MRMAVLLFISLMKAFVCVFVPLCCVRLGTLFYVATCDMWPMATFKTDLDSPATHNSLNSVSVRVLYISSIASGWIARDQIGKPDVFGQLCL